MHVTPPSSKVVVNAAANAAYAAAAQALKLNMLAYGADILGLAFKEEELVEDGRWPYAVSVDTRGLRIPILNVSLQDWRRRGPGSATEVLARAIGRLAMTRVWRKRRTAGPPAGLIETNVIAKALVERGGIHPQSFVDAVWRPVGLDEKYSDTADWRSREPAPALLDRSPIAGHPERVIFGGLPWLAGHSTLDAVFVEAVALSDEVVIYWRPQQGDQFEIRVAPTIPHTIVNALSRAPLRKLISHPLLNRHDFWIRSVRTHQKSIRFTVEGGALFRKARFKGGNDERQDLKEESKRLRPARRQLEAMIAGHLSIPGRHGDIDAVPGSDIDFDLDDVDEFTGVPWPPRPTFDGISARRAGQHSRHDDGDPVIMFEEDDPTAYEWADLDDEPPIFG